MKYHVSDSSDLPRTDSIQLLETYTPKKGIKSTLIAASVVAGVLWVVVLDKKSETLIDIKANAAPLISKPGILSGSEIVSSSLIASSSLSSITRLESTPQDWKEHLAIKNSIEKYIKTRDLKFLTDLIPKLNWDEQLLMLSALKQFGIIDRNLIQAQYFNKIPSDQMASNLFSGLVLSRQSLREIYLGMIDGGIMSKTSLAEWSKDRFMIQEFYSNLDLLTDIPYEYLVQIVEKGTDEEKRFLSNAAPYYAKFLTPQQREAVRIWLERVGYFPMGYLSDSDRLKAAHVYIANGTLDNISEMLRPGDPVDFIALRSRLIGSGDYIGALSTHSVSPMNEWERFEFTLRALSNPTTKAYSLIKLVENDSIPTSAYRQVNQALERMGELEYIVRHSPKLMEAFGRPPLTAKLLQSDEGLGLVAEYIDRLSPTSQQTDEILRRILSDERQFRHLGLVIRYRAKLG